MAVAKLRRIIALLMLPVVVYGLWVVRFRSTPTEVYAIDPLVVTYNGTAPPDPVFSITNMLPGDEEEKVFNVLNDSPTDVGILMEGMLTEETKEFADILEIIIGEQGGSDIYGGTTGYASVQDFLDAGDISLGVFPAGTDRDYRVKVKFPSSAGNEYQNAKVVFDIKWKTDLPPIELPPECKHLEGIITEVVYGTPGNDRIHTTTASELIYLYEGDDKLNSSSGSDCIVAGPGNDKIEEGTGDGVVLGGPGNDNIRVGTGNDKVYGGEGNDNISTGSGNDIVYGGPGNDVIRAGSGVDEVYGEDGLDKIWGGSSSDYLDGGNDYDRLDGDSGTDTCVNGENLHSCEII